MLSIHAIGLLAATVAHHGTDHSGGEHIAHLVVIAGMVLVLVGVVVDGARRQFARRRGGHLHGGPS